MESDEKRRKLEELRAERVRRQEKRRFKRIVACAICFGLVCACVIAFMLFRPIHKEETSIGEPSKVSDEVSANWDGPYLKTLEWLANNIYRVEAYKEESSTDEDGNAMCSVYLVRVPDVSDKSFEELVQFVESQSFNEYNTDSGVNCKWITTVVADWADAHNYKYDINGSSQHVNITLLMDSKNYLFDWGTNPVIAEVESDGQTVVKSLI